MASQKFGVYSSRPSKGARALARALPGKRLKSWQPLPNRIIINWGDSQCPSDQVLNTPAAIRLAANKALAFDALSSANVPIPDYAKTKEGVTWSGITVVRHKLSGHSGEGIEICNCNPAELPDAPLYVRYIKKEQEYRVHVGKQLQYTTPDPFAGPDEVVKVIAIQRKARDTSNPNPNWQVRNHDNGFVFVRGGFVAPPSVLDAAKQAVVTLGLDFGAVDLVWNGQSEKAYVLEVNTAPGLEGTTVADYASFFRGVAE